MEIIFVTSNKGKVITLKKAVAPFGIKVSRRKFNVPEIQELDVSKVAKFSARYAAEKIKKPVIVTDAGLYIKALNGFPGSLLKFLNVWFTPQDIIKMMAAKKDRTATAKDCLAYCEPGQKPVLFTSQIKCWIADKPRGKGTTVDQLLIWPGIENKTRGEITDDEMMDYWSRQITIYSQLVKYLWRKKRQK